MAVVGEGGPLDVVLEEARIALEGARGVRQLAVRSSEGARGQKIDENKSWRTSRRANNFQRREALATITILRLGCCALFASSRSKQARGRALHLVVGPRVVAQRSPSIEATYVYIPHAAPAQTWRKKPIVAFCAFARNQSAKNTSCMLVLSPRQVEADLARSSQTSPGRDLAPILTLA